MGGELTQTEGRTHFNPQGLNFSGLYNRSKPGAACHCRQLSCAVFQAVEASVGVFMGKKCVVLSESLAVYCCLAKSWLFMPRECPGAVYKLPEKKRESSAKLFLQPEGVMFTIFVYSLQWFSRTTLNRLNMRSGLGPKSLSPIVGSARLFFGYNIRPGRKTTMRVLWTIE